MSGGDNLDNNFLNLSLSLGTPSQPHVGRGDGVPHFVIRFYQQVAMPRRHRAPGEHLAALQNGPPGNPARNVVPPFNQGFGPHQIHAAQGNDIPEDIPDLLQDMPPPLNPMVFVNIDLLTHQGPSMNPSRGERRAVSQSAIPLGNPREVSVLLRHRVVEQSPGLLDLGHHQPMSLEPAENYNIILDQEPPGNRQPSQNLVLPGSPLPQEEPLLLYEDSLEPEAEMEGRSSPNQNVLLLMPEDDELGDENPVFPQVLFIDYIHVEDMLPREDPYLEIIIGPELDPEYERNPVLEQEAEYGPVLQQNRVPQENLLAEIEGVPEAPLIPGQSPPPELEQEQDQVVPPEQESAGERQTLPV